MAKIEFYYNTEKCTYQKIEPTFKDKIRRIAIYLSLSVVVASGMFKLSQYLFKSPKEVYLSQEINDKLFYLDVHKKRLLEISQQLKELEKKDDQIYRIIFEVDPISPSIRSAGIGGSERYASLIGQDLVNEVVLLDIYHYIDQLKRKMYIQSKSYDEIVKLAFNREKLLAAIPAIQPLKKNQCRLTSGFGMRFHPILNYKRLHTGIDFSAPNGTPIYATADGVVAYTRSSATGYGMEIELDHGFGYRTKYAHMSAFNAKKGQRVKRGDGYVGNTGTSTASHLHYEVIKNGSKINPVHYFFHDLNEDEYSEILELASIENASMGM